MEKSPSRKPSALALNNGRITSYVPDGNPTTLEDMRFQTARIVQIAIGEAVGEYSQNVWAIVSGFSKKDLKVLNPELIHTQRGMAITQFAREKVESMIEQLNDKKRWATVIEPLQHI